MEIILTNDVPTLGYRGDVVTVRPGYARNYLIPQGLGIIANATNKKVIAENQRQGSRRIAKAREDAQAIATQLQGMNLQINAKVGTSGRIFGSITTLQIAQALKDQGIEIDRRKIHLPAEIKELGSHQAVVDLHKEVKATLPIEVIGVA